MVVRYGLLKFVKVKGAVSVVSGVPDEQQDSQAFRHFRRVAPEVLNQEARRLVYGVSPFYFLVLVVPCQQLWRDTQRCPRWLPPLVIPEVRVFRPEDQTEESPDGPAHSYCLCENLKLGPYYGL